MAAAQMCGSLFVWKNTEHIIAEKMKIFHQHTLENV